MLTQDKVYSANKGWFSSANAKFFGDDKYEWLRGGISNKLYLLQHTSMWSDMLGRPKKMFWVVRDLDQNTGKILSANGCNQFDSFAAAENWIKGQ